MITARKIGISLIFMLIIVGRLLAFSNENSTNADFPVSENSSQATIPVIQNQTDNYLYATEVNNYAQVIAEKHRLNSWQLPTNQVVPRNFDFRNFKSFPIPTIYNLQVPIFIMNRALLN